jgi:hypothetical protein
MGSQLAPAGRSRPRSLAAAAWRGAWFGAKFTFCFLGIIVSIPMILMGLGRFVAEGFSLFTLLRFMVFATGVPIAGAFLGACVAAVLLPVASLLDGSTKSDKWIGYEEPASPWDDEAPQSPRSRDELLRRIVSGDQRDAAEPT